MNAPCAPVTSCIVEPDAQPDDILWRKDRSLILVTDVLKYRHNIVMTYRPKSYICDESLIIQN